MVNIIARSSRLALASAMLSALSLATTATAGGMQDQSNAMHKAMQDQHLKMKQQHQQMEQMHKEASSPHLDLDEHMDGAMDKSPHQGAGAHDQMPAMHGEMQAPHGGTHGHASWNEPPAAYRGVQGPDWEDADAAKRGETIFQQQCAACHGNDGRGSGPLAASLDHPPADLTIHFHQSPGMGDDYLFWRVSEGGQVEPFKSAGSAMPSFKGTLSESQRWDVLNYVHQQFHQGFPDGEHQTMEAPHAGDKH